MLCRTSAAAFICFAASAAHASRQGIVTHKNTMNDLCRLFICDSKHNSSKYPYRSLQRTSAQCEQVGCSGWLSISDQAPWRGCGVESILPFTLGSAKSVTPRHQLSE